MATIIDVLRLKPLRTIAVGLAALFALSFLNWCFPVASEELDLKLFDYVLYHQPSPRPSGNVVIAAIDNRTINQFGWPFPRTALAHLVDALNADEVALIGFDMLFLDKRPDDPLLVSAILRHSPTFIGYHFKRLLKLPDSDPSLFLSTFQSPGPLTYNLVRSDAGERSVVLESRAGYQAPIAEFNSAALSSFDEVDQDADGIVRDFPTVIVFDRRYCVPLFLAIADGYLNRAPLRLELDRFGVAGVAAGSRVVPVDEMGRMMVHFRGPEGSMPRFSAADIIDHSIPAGALKHKAVIIGATATGYGDRFSTPVGGNFPGVEIQANAADNVIKGDFVHRSAYRVEEEVGGWLLGFAITIAAAWFGALAALLVTFGLVGACVVYALARLWLEGALVGIGFPLANIGVVSLIVLGDRYITESKERTRVTVEKGRLAERVEAYQQAVERFGKRSSLPQLGEGYLTTMFADLSGFTKASTQMTAVVLTAKVNRYFADIVPAIENFGGRIDEFRGDSALGYWRSPLDDPDEQRKQAIGAVRAAFALIEVVNRVRAEDEARQQRGFEIKVGINSGPGVIEFIGSGPTPSCTVMGGDVNLAARLESVPPQYGCLIVLGEKTAKLVSGEFLLRELDSIKVKGADEPMKIYQPIVELANATAEQKELVNSYVQALVLYRQMKFKEASDIWTRLLPQEPFPSPSSIMYARAIGYMQHPLAAPWNGVYELTSK